MTERFLRKLNREGKLKLVEPTEDICNSYSEKSANCLKSAKLLFKNNLFENSIGESYYAMYNQLLSLLFKTGIKCENRRGSILLLKLLYADENLYQLISNAKKERIDKQYYVTTEKYSATKEIASELLSKTEKFILKIKVIIKNLNNDSTNELRKLLKNLIN